MRALVTYAIKRAARVRSKLDVHFGLTLVLHAHFAVPLDLTLVRVGLPA